MLILLGVGACQSRAESFHGEQVYHLESLSKILARTPGNTEAVMQDMDKYLQENMKRLMDARRERRDLLQSMSPDERATFEKETVDATRRLRERINTAIGTFPDPPKVLSKARLFFL